MELDTTHPTKVIQTKRFGRMNVPVVRLFHSPKGKIRFTTCHYCELCVHTLMEHPNQQRGTCVVCCRELLG